MVDVQQLQESRSTLYAKAELFGKAAGRLLISSFIPFPS